MPIDEIHAKEVAETTRQPTDVSRRSLLRGATLAAGGAVFVATTMTASALKPRWDRRRPLINPPPKTGRVAQTVGSF